MTDRPMSRQMGCPICGHEHCFLDCERCDCAAHIQQGVYPDLGIT